MKQSPPMLDGQTEQIPGSFRADWYKRWPDLCSLLLFLIAGWWALKELWQPGIPNQSDFFLSVYRVYELDAAWQNGIWFPRLGPDLNFGYGAPLFQFYPPLVSYIALLFHQLGWGFLDATKLTLSLNLILGAIGVYVYLRWLTGRYWGALCAALLYLYAPYLLLVAYERGAAAEGLALALLPWLFWLLHRQLCHTTVVGTLFAACVVALTMLAHNITALFAIPAVILYVMLLAILSRRWWQLASIFGAVVLGLMLSAFYWTPALLELAHTRAQTDMLAEQANVVSWLTSIADLFQETLIASYSGEERFRFSLWYGLLGLGSLLPAHDEQQTTQAK